MRTCRIVLSLAISVCGVAAAQKTAEKAAAGSVILAMLPDTGERYLSTVLFVGVNTGPG